MKLRIVSDGTITGTKVLTETGESILGITDISWSLGVDREKNPARIKLELDPISCPVKLIGELKDVQLLDERRPR